MRAFRCAARPCVARRRHSPPPASSWGSLEGCRGCQVGGGNERTAVRISVNRMHRQSKQLKWRRAAGAACIVGQQRKHTSWGVAISSQTVIGMSVTAMLACERLPCARCGACWCMGVIALYNCLCAKLHILSGTRSLRRSGGACTPPASQACVRTWQT
jgi:hypothetical protein